MAEDTEVTEEMTEEVADEKSDGESKPVVPPHVVVIQIAGAKVTTHVQGASLLEAQKAIEMAHGQVAKMVQDANTD